MIRIGMVDFDTSHVVAFTQRLNHIDIDEEQWVDGAKVVIGCPGESKISPERIPGFTEKMREYGVELVERPEEMIGKIDAVMIESLDGRIHLEEAKKVIAAGKPLFIDKPLAYSREDLEWFSEQVARGRHIVSCSSMRYSAGVQAARVHIPELGTIELALAVGKKSWRTYAIHYLEGMLSLLGDPKIAAVRHVSGAAGKDIVYLEFENGLLATVHVFMEIAPVSDLIVYGENGSLKVDHGGAYVSFRNAATEAIRGFIAGSPRLEFSKTRNVISALIAARESLEQGGKRITIA